MDPIEFKGMNMTFAKKSTPIHSIASTKTERWKSNKCVGIDR